MSTRSHVSRHETHKQVFYRFCLLLLIIATYTGFLAYHYGFATGGLVSVITWSFFVLCTPVADAGMLLDLPLRLLLKIRMIKSELLVWAMAIGVNIILLTTKPTVYDTTLLTRLFREILTTPYPYWLVIGLSAMGTFLSVLFADELLDVIKHHERALFHKYQFWLQVIGLIAIFVGLLFLYDLLIHQTGLQDVLKLT